MTSATIKNKPTIFIVGPTASGKSSLAMTLARRIGGEIIAADSQTMKKDLNIGTAKPSINDRKEIPHHLVDIISPYDKFNVADFQELAFKCIQDIHNRAKIPIIVGGTGLYIDSLFFNYSFSKSHGDQQKTLLEKKSVEALQKIIKEAGYQLPKNDKNPRHLVGTILRKGKNSKDKQPIKGALMYGILIDDLSLKIRIKERVGRMYTEGMIEEAEDVLNKYSKPLCLIDAISYPIVGKLIKGKVTLEQAKKEHFMSEWQYARRQKSWLRRNSYIKWVKNTQEDIEQIIKYLNNT